MKINLLLPLLCVSVLSSTHAATFTVTSTADSGLGSLRQAILDANAELGPHTLELSTLAGTITLETPLPAVAQDLSITGPGRDVLAISGGGAVRVLQFQPGNKSTLYGLTISNGLAPTNQNGGGILNSGSLTLNACRISSNATVGGFGGGIYNQGNLWMSFTSLEYNTARGGDGTIGGGGGGGLGGAVFTSSGMFQAKDCVFIGNQAIGGKGGPSVTTGYNGIGGGINGGQNGAAGGFGGGGASATSCYTGGGTGGFGGGGGSGANTLAGSHWFGAHGGVGAGQGEGPNGCFYPGGGGGGAGIGGAVFLNGGTAFLVNLTFTNNAAIGGAGGLGGGTGPAWPGENGTGIEPNSYRAAGTIILPRLTVVFPGGGSASTYPTDIPYLNNSLATVTAYPDDGWSFLGWLGDASGTNPVMEVSVTRNKYIQAVFGTTLSIGSEISATPQSPFYPYGTVVKLTATPPAGNFFLSWDGAANGATNPMNFVITTPQPSVLCQLGILSLGQFSLTVAENGQGHVITTPKANFYTNGQTVTLTPIPDSGQEFIGWSGDTNGFANPLAVAMDNSKIITANFTRRPKLKVGTPLEGLVEKGFRLTLNGEFGTAHSILGSTNLLDWSFVGTVTNTYGEVQLTDPAATNLLYRFYRAESQ